MLQPEKDMFQDMQVDQAQTEENEGFFITEADANI
jgi:hypothetical protein